MKLQELKRLLILVFAILSMSICVLFLWAEGVLLFCGLSILALLIFCRDKPTPPYDPTADTPPHTMD